MQFNICSTGFEYFPVSASAKKKLHQKFDGVPMAEIVETGKVFKTGV